MKKKKFRKRPKYFLFGPSSRCKKIFFRTVADLSLHKKIKKTIRHRSFSLENSVFVENVDFRQI